MLYIGLRYVSVASNVYWSWFNICAEVMFKSSCCWFFVSLSITLWTLYRCVFWYGAFFDTSKSALTIDQPNPSHQSCDKTNKPHLPIRIHNYNNSCDVVRQTCLMIDVRAMRDVEGREGGMLVVIPLL